MRKTERHSDAMIIASLVPDGYTGSSVSLSKASASSACVFSTDLPPSALSTEDLLTDDGVREGVFVSSFSTSVVELPWLEIGGSVVGNASAFERTEGPDRPKVGNFMVDYDSEDSRRGRRKWRRWVEDCSAVSGRRFDRGFVIGENTLRTWYYYTAQRSG